MNKKYIATLTLVIIILNIFLCLFFVAKTSHICNEKNCEICIMTEKSKKIFKILNLNKNTIFIIPIEYIYVICIFINNFSKHETLITKKVELLN